VTPPTRELLAFAEDPGAFLAPGPDEERVDAGAAVVTVSPGRHFWSARVCRVRMEPTRIERDLGSIRSLVRSRGRGASAWSVGLSATPPDVVDRLLDLGLTAESDAVSEILVLTSAPPASAAPFAVRPVTTEAGFAEALEVSIAGFGFPPEDAEDERSRARASFEAERDGARTIRLVAYDDARPVAIVQAWFAEQGLYLGGGATLPADRRRGAMTSLVVGAWDEAVRRGTPALVTHAGSMAAPALRRLGFGPTGRIRHLIDRG
jgi:hypothetical protein